MIDAVERTTGKPVVLRPETGLQGRANAAYVASDTSETRHLIVYDPAKSHLANHIIPHELGHLGHFLKFRPAARLLPIIRTDERIRARAVVLGALPVRIRATNTAETLRLAADEWISGCVGQVTSFPADISIEHDLWAQHPDLRSAQREALAATAQDAHRVLQSEASCVTPSRVLNASNSMNYALLKAASRFLREPWMVRPYRGTPSERIGEELLEIYSTEHPSDLPGFQAVSSRWAQRLGLREWFIWAPVSSLLQAPNRIWD